MSFVFFFGKISRTTSALGCVRINFSKGKTKQKQNKINAPFAVHLPHRTTLNLVSLLCQVLYLKRKWGPLKYVAPPCSLQSWIWSVKKYCSAHGETRSWTVYITFSFDACISQQGGDRKWAEREGEKERKTGVDVQQKVPSRTWIVDVHGQCLNPLGSGGAPWGTVYGWTNYMWMPKAVNDKLNKSGIGLVLKSNIAHKDLQRCPQDIQKY